MFGFKSTTWYLYPLLCILLWLLLFSFESRAYATKDSSKKATAVEATNNNEQIDFLPIEEFQKFATAYQIIKKYYVFDITDKALIDNAIKGMMSGLDPHSVYLDDKSMNNFHDFNDGNFSGIGIEVILENGMAKIISTMDNTPASKAGIKSGDIITSINGKKLIKNYNEILSSISGKPNTLVNLAVFRPSAKKELCFSLKRQKIKFQSVDAININNEFGYIKIKIFNGATNKEFYNELKQLTKKYTNNKIKGIILDLRNNPGGIIESAVDICSYFVQKSLIVYTQGKNSKFKTEYYSKKMPISLFDIPIAILINDGSASCAEIIAGAFQDYNRAVVIGTKSFGKGSVQRIASLTEDGSSGIKLTTDLYYTPKGRSIQFTGVVPDINIPPAIITLKEPEDTISEQDLYAHKKPIKNVTNTSKTSIELKNLLSDYQVDQALQVLKGMAFMKTK
jgi:carboxyl-terminal processing protease